MPKSLVIGANGFLGSHLVDELAERGHDVTAFDRFSSGRISFDADVERISGDFLNQVDVREAVEGQEQVMHFLSTTTPASVAEEPRVDLRTNVAQTLDLLDACVDAGVQRVVFASSGGSVYGDQEQDRYAETDPTFPVSPYAIGKVAIENFLRYYSRQHGLDYLVLRISNPYGARQHPNRRQGLIPVALANVLADEPVRVFGDGSMVRDYAYARDIVSMAGTLVDGDPIHRVYNLGSGVGHTIGEVIECIRSITGERLRTETVEAPATFVRSVVLDIDRYRSEFGEPHLTALEDGIRRTWESMIADAEAASA